MLRFHFLSCPLPLHYSPGPFSRCANDQNTVGERFSVDQGVQGIQFQFPTLIFGKRCVALMKIKDSLHEV
jgi:hypothetical protein